EVQTPAGVIVSAVAMDSASSDAVYIGAANELAIYRSLDRGQNWLRVPLTDEYIGGVTDLAVDSAQRLVYVGTDTAGLFRLRDVGSSLVNSGQLLLDEPVLEVVADNTGLGMAFARTAWHLYRAESFGLTWSMVDNLQSTPTAIAIADTNPATVYVGTTDRGVLKSQDGLSWTLANAGLGLVPGSRLSVNDIAVDPAQPDVLYVATNYLYGTSELHATPSTVAMSTDEALAWAPIEGAFEGAVAELLPVAGQTGALYALTSQSRSPMALGSAPVATAASIVAEPVATTVSFTTVLAWVIAGLAALALLFAIVNDVRSRRSELEVGGKLATSTVRHTGS
ncbi:MAG: hypothetical protein HC802_14460, partial [Caldilineaceae bacterium]|nr:hypothetical protein [Caldilineaceae bacterium]